VVEAFPPPKRRTRMLYNAIASADIPLPDALRIQNYLEMRYARKISIGWLYGTLEKLEAQGYIMGEKIVPSASIFVAHGRRPTRIYQVTAKPPPPPKEPGFWRRLIKKAT
jgi:hypothetical protein